MNDQRDPIVLFGEWFAAAEAADLPLPEAMTVATSTSDGRPSARVMLLKEFDQRGFVFFTNYGSRKARELDANPHVTLVLHWAPLERQIRVEGTAERIPTEESEAYYRTRPLGSRIGAWASRQSDELDDRATLEARVQKFADQYGDDPPLPPFWGGYRVTPEVIEFWQGMPSRLHDRLVYERRGDSWVTKRLQP